MSFKTWVTWWIGDSIGALFIVPFAHKLYTSKVNTSFETEKVLKLVGLALLTSVICFLVFNTRK